MPEILYHYTNIDALALILKNRTIRLTPLNKMDDLEENMTSDLENAGMFTYVSSWTNQKRESIALWKQYTNHDTGVRIKLPVYPFKKRLLSDMIPSNLSKYFNITDPDMRSIIRYDEMLNSKYFTQVITGNDILHEVKYTDDDHLVIPKIVSHNSNDATVQVALGKVGKHKRIDWEYQHEWRYIIQFLPANLIEVTGNEGKNFCIIVNKLIAGELKQPFPYYDLDIDDNAFQKMEITLSPTISPGNEVLIRNTIEKYNPKAIILNSLLKGKLR